MEATSKLAQLVELYQQELARYRIMLALAEEQKSCVEASNYPVLAEILERRDRMSQEVTASSVHVRALCQQISEALGLPEINLTSLRSKLSEQVLSPLAAVLAEITVTIEKIQAADQVSESQIKQVLGTLRGQMGQVERGQVAMKAYRQQPLPRDTRATDRQK